MNTGRMSDWLVGSLYHLRRHLEEGTLVSHGSPLRGGTWDKLMGTFPDGTEVWLGPPIPSNLGRVISYEFHFTKGHIVEAQ